MDKETLDYIKQKKYKTSAKKVSEYTGVSAEQILKIWNPNRGKNRSTPEKMDKLRAMGPQLTEGLTIEQICRKYKVCATTAQVLITENEGNRLRTWTTEEVKEVESWQRGEQSLKDAALKIGRSEQAVRNHGWRLRGKIATEEKDKKSSPEGLQKGDEGL